MDISEYLLSFGAMGEVGRFRPARPMACRRGDRAVVRTFRGVEMAEVLCPATPGHAHFFVNTSVGALLRLADDADERTDRVMRDRAATLFDHGRALAEEFGLPVELLDAEVLLDGQHGILHHLRWEEFDERPLVSALSRRHELAIALHHLALPKAADDPSEGCGAEGCGSGSCGTGGGCESGGCGSCTSHAHAAPAVSPTDRARFAALRDQMHAAARTPLV